jgi:dienelactone hydrolase/uncharacterized protein (DUF2141 family)
MPRWTFLPLLAAASLVGLPAAAQTLTVNITNVNSNEGRVMASICGDPTAQFPGGCNTASAMVPASQGTTTVVFENVAPGSYALQAFHDANADMIPNIPPEGFAFGNDASFPPSFKSAAVKVEGDTIATVRMNYLSELGSAAPPKAAPAEKGAPAPAGVAKTVVRDDGLLGAFYMPEGTARRPALLVLGGSEGGLSASSGVGVSFAKQGYAVLALAYFMEDGLPQSLENIPLEYFDKAIDWLKRQPGVDADAIGVIGGSRGSEAALLLASRNTSIKAVMAFAPSGVVWQGLNFANPMNMGPAWTVDGKALPFVTPDGMKYRPGAAMKPMFDAALATETRKDVDIPVERIKAPILLISGKEDALWPSFDMGEAITKRLAAANFAYPVQHLAYDGAGHMVFMGDPTAASAQSMSRTPPNAMMGGTPEAGLAAWTQNWPLTLAFFDNALKGQ